MPHSSSHVVAVTGSTGFVGRAVVAELLRRGHRVRALVRDAAKAERVLPASGIESGRLTLITGDVLAEGVCEKLLTGADACVHLIGIIRESQTDGSTQSFQRAHVTATQRVLEACEHESARRSGAGKIRYAHMSALGVSGHGRAAYQRTKFEAEQAVRLSRTDWTVFRPGLIHGPDGEFMRMAKGWCEGRALPFVFVPYFTRLETSPEDTSALAGLPRPVTPRVAPVRVEDVAWAFAESLERPETIGETYNLTGPEELGMDQMLRELRDALPLGKKSMPVVGIPGEMAEAKAIGAGLVGLGGLLPFDAGMAIMGRADATAECGKAREELGWRPVPYTPAVKEYAARM